jgi:hypothetical protein
LALLNNILKSLKRKALRQGLWFKNLNSIERGIVDLCIIIKKEVKSVKLLEILTEIVKKMVKKIKSFSKIEQWIKSLKMASSISQIAVNWSYKEAERWARDPNFIKYLSKMWIEKRSFSLTLVFVTKGLPK